MSQNFATLDQATLGPLLELQDGGMICTFNTTGASAARNARSTQAITAGRHYWECIVYGDEALVADTAIVGLVVAGSSNAAAPGVAPTTVGYRPGDGTCWQSGSSIATVATAPLRSVIGCALDLDSPTKTLVIRVNRLVINTFTLPAGQVWLPAVSVSGAVAYRWSVFANFGARGFEDDAPDGYRRGVFTTSQPFSTIRVASEDWTSPATAATPNVGYAGQILNASRFSIDSSVSFWTWARSGQGNMTAELELSNNGEYDHLVTESPRGARVLARLIDRDNPTAAPIPIASMILDKAERSSPKAIRLRLRDSLAQLDTPIQRRRHLPYVADGAAGRPLPISLGACRNVSPVLVDAARRAYVMHDGPLTQIAAVRDKGDKLDPLAAPPDWSVTPDQRGVELQADAKGKVSADISSSGAPVIVGAPDIDVLAGYGAMTTAAGGMPAEWVAVSLFHATASRVATDGGRLRTQSSGIVASNPRVAWDIRFRDFRYARDWLPIKRGCYYRITYSIKAARWTSVVGLGQFAGGWYVIGAGVTGIAGGVSTQFQPGELTVDFRAPCDGTLAWYGAGLIDPAQNGGDAGPWWVEIDNVVCKLKSADCPDLLAGFGNFMSGLARWSTLAVSLGCSVAHGLQVSVEYPSPGLGAMVLTISAGAGRIAQAAYMGAGFELQAGRNYRIAVRFDGSTGNARLRVRALHTVSGVTTTVATLSASSAEATFQVGAASWLVLEGFTSDDQSGIVRVSLARCLDITAQLAESATIVPLDGIKLAAFCANVLESRCRLGAAEWVSSDAEAIDAAAGYVFGVHVADEVTARAMLRAPLDSFTACEDTDSSGRIRIVQLAAPEDAPDAAVVLEIDKNNAADAPLVTADDADGLTLRFGARRNWSLHSDSDFVEDTDALTGIDPASRTRFKQLSQYVVASAQPLAAKYARARDAGPLDSLLDVPAHAQAEIDRVAALYAVPRAFYQVTVRFDGAPPPVRNGSVIRLRWDRWGLQAGKKLFVRRVRLMPCALSVEITAWG